MFLKLSATFQETNRAVVYYSISNCVLLHLNVFSRKSCPFAKFSAKLLWKSEKVMGVRNRTSLQLVCRSFIMAGGKNSSCTLLWALNPLVVSCTMLPRLEPLFSDNSFPQLRNEHTEWAFVWVCQKFFCFYSHFQMLFQTTERLSEHHLVLHRGVFLHMNYREAEISS